MNLDKQRKVKMFLLTLAVLSAGLFAGKVSGQEYYMGAVALYGCFAAGNAAEHISKKKKK